MYFIGTSLVLIFGAATQFFMPDCYELLLVAFTLTAVLVARARLKRNVKSYVRVFEKTKTEYQKRYRQSYNARNWFGHAGRIGTGVVGHATGAGWGISLGNMALDIGADLLGRPRDPEKAALKAKIRAQHDRVKWEHTKFWAFVITHLALLDLCYEGFSWLQ